MTDIHPTHILRAVNARASLVVLCLRICLPMQMPWVQSLVQEDPTSGGASKSLHQNYWASGPRGPAPQREKAGAQGKRPSAATNDETQLPGSALSLGSFRSAPATQFKDTATTSFSCDLITEENMLALRSISSLKNTCTLCGLPLHKFQPKCHFSVLPASSKHSSLLLCCYNLYWNMQSNSATLTLDHPFFPK